MPVEVEIQIGSRLYRRDLPASWKEVPEARRLLLCRILFRFAGERGRIEALRKLLDVPGKVWRRLTPGHAIALLDALPWLAIRPDPEPWFETFTYRRRRYYLPGAYGMNLVALEYPIADEAFMDYVRTGSPDALRLLCGTLCREAEEEPAAAIRRGDRRVPLLSRPEAEARALRYTQLPMHIQQAVFLYFAGVKEYVNRSYGPILFEQPETDERGNPVQVSTTPTLGWWSVYFSTAADGPFGKLEQLYQTGFHDVCLYLVDRIRAQREMEMRSKLASRGFGE